MVWDSGSLQTRQFARRNLALPARIEVHPDHAEQLRLSFPDEGGRPTVVDVSEGGLGLQSQIYLPRNARLMVHVKKGNDAGDSDSFLVRGIVRRCGMMDVRPTFHVGVQYLESQTPEIRELVALAEQIKAQNSATSAEDRSSGDSTHAD